MKIKANTFPDGSRVGTVIVSPVTADKLPMAPPAGGATFGVPAWTIQPAGTRFDPPIKVTLPNAGGYPAGDNLPIVQWDHDLGQYVAMGRATVSEDGAVLVTDSGSGLTKAGWGGLCRYDPDKCAAVKQPTITKLEIKVIGDGDSIFGGRAGEIWVGQDEPLAFVSDDAAQSCKREYTWNFGDGSTSNARNPFHEFKSSGQFEVMLGLKCIGDECTNAMEKNVTKTINVCEGSNSNSVIPEFVEVPPVRTKGKALAGSGKDGNFGQVGYEKISVTDIGVSCEKGDWFPTVKGVRGEFSKFLNLNRSNTQNITSSSEADSVWFCAQAQGLSNEPTSAKYSGPDWVNWSAVEVHEQFHLNGIRSRFDSKYVNAYNDYLKSNLRLPVSQFSKQAALEQFRQSTLLGNSNAEEQFRIIDANDGNREDGLNRRGPAYLAEFAVNAPLVNAICKRANSLGWNSGNSCLICNGK